MNALKLRGSASAQTRAAVREEPAILRALDAGLDTASLEDAGDAPAFFAAQPANSPEKLRLPLPPGAGRDVRAASERILRADTSRASPDREAVEKEARLLRVLEALAGVADFVALKSAGERRS
jgi:hypothetical protein